jgi:membrane associated rhomboid family serine protease
MTPWVMFLLLANGAVYLLINQMAPLYAGLLAFQPLGLLARPWTPITYMFVHASFGHIFWNMLTLYFFGPRVESRLGGTRFIGLYVVSGLAGALLSFIDPAVFIVGASGAVFGVELAYARYWPRDRIYIWGILPIEAWLMVLLMTGVSLFGGLGRVGNVAHWAHLGGFAGAALYLAVLDRLSPSRQFKAASRSGGGAAGRVLRPGILGERAALEKWSRIRGDDLHEVNRAELERIRRIITERGVSALSADERAFLDRFSAH